MTNVRARHRRRGYVGALLMAGALLSGCALGLAEQEQTAAARRRQATAAQERRASEEAARRQAAAHRELEEKVAHQHLQLLEKDAEIRALNQKLETAILEVVRAMAKLRGLSGRAEAASNLAETEIAVKSVPAEPSLRPRDADLRQAEHLLKMATEEFKNQNYDGTVYLTSQVKMLIRPPSDRPAKSDAGGTGGELTLSPTLSLRAAGRTNVRQGPGANFKVVFVIEPGTPVSGLGYSGLWVRVKTDDGRSGWVHYSLLVQR